SNALDALVRRLASDPRNVGIPLQKRFATTDVRVLALGQAPLTWIGMQPSVRALSRWSGRALVDGTEVDWSLILKAWLRDPKTDPPTVWNYWKREFVHLNRLTLYLT